LGNGFPSSGLDIPAGKRFVIKNVSVITLSPEGMRMEVNFFTYIDRNGDNVGDIADITLICRPPGNATKVGVARFSSAAVKNPHGARPSR
jgi:hypothetical protein